MRAFFFLPEAANNFTFIYSQRFGKSTTCRKKQRDRSRRLFFPSPLQESRTVSFSIVTLYTLSSPDRSLITVSLINPLRVCAGMPELPGRLADGTVRQVQREELQGSQLCLGALRRR